VHGYFRLQLRGVASYPLLRADVLQRAREAGNGMLFLTLLDEAAERARFAGLEVTGSPQAGRDGEGASSSKEAAGAGAGAVESGAGAEEWDCDWWDARTWGGEGEEAPSQPWGEEQSGGDFPGGTPGPVSGPPKRSVMPYFLRGLRGAMYAAVGGCTS
jgi:hypothetical protein